MWPVVHELWMVSKDESVLVVFLSSPLLNIWTRMYMTHGKLVSIVLLYNIIICMKECRTRTPLTDMTYRHCC